MDWKEYRDLLDQLGMTQLTAAKLFGVNPRTGRHWALGETPVPKAVGCVLRLMVRFELTPEDIEDIYRGRSAPGPGQFWLDDVVVEETRDSWIERTLKS